MHFVGLFFLQVPRYVYLYVYADPTCAKFDLAPDLEERKYGVSRVVCVCMYIQNGRKEIIIIMFVKG